VNQALLLKFWFTTMLFVWRGELVQAFSCKFGDYKTYMHQFTLVKGCLKCGLLNELILHA